MFPKEFVTCILSKLHRSEHYSRTSVSQSLAVGRRRPIGTLLRLLHTIRRAPCSLDNNNLNNSNYCV